MEFNLFGKTVQITNRAEDPEELERDTSTTQTENSIEAAETLLRAFLASDFMTLEKAMNVPSFAGCVNLICDTIGSIPAYLYKRNGDSIERLDNDERVKLINDDTRDTLTGVDFKKAIIFDYLTNKGGYAYINKRGTRYVSLNYVDPAYINFQYSENPIFKDYNILCRGETYRPYRFLKLIRRTKNGYYGKSLVQENSEVLKTAYMSLLFEEKLVKKGGNKKGFLESEHKLSQDAIDALKAAFNLLYQQENENVIVLNNGVKFNESSETSTEMQLNENKKSNAVEICKIFNMPPNMLSGTPTEADKIKFIQYCIIPILEVFAKSLNRDFLLEREKKNYFWGFDIRELTKGDLKTRYEAYAVAMKNGFLQIDDIREAENLPKLDMPFIKLGLQDVLYDPETGMIFTPNMGKGYNIKEAMSGKGSGDLTSVVVENSSPTTPSNQAKTDSEKADGKETEDEDQNKS
ncbi:MAG: phage portal protein [Butyrivibrio sp.]|uniref:phage portal protein n=1 Tax=Butyrivibrio sp. TaxID=28121 RepID=UPI001B3FC6EB|nr:phage portal protein [Butyrivibrio sp.]MBP3784592.1 phage portal protein [Butyrivibrio sp.]